MAITAKELRKQSKKEDRQVCEACSGHESITQKHHLLPLKKCAMFLNTGLFKDFGTPVVWLCPNCHMYLHQMMRGLYHYSALGNEPEVNKNLRGLLEKYEKWFFYYLDEVIAYEK